MKLVVKKVMETVLIKRGRVYRCEGTIVGDSDGGGCGMKTLVMILLVVEV